MKKIELKNNFKNEKGSITIFVLSSMIFFVAILLSIYVSNVNKNTNMNKSIKNIEKQYTVTTEDLEQAYQETLTKNNMVNYDTLPADFWTYNGNNIVINSNYIDSTNNCIKGGYSKIIIPASVNGVQITGVNDSSGFTGLSGITNIKISEGITRVEGRAFKDCKDLEDIEFPNTLYTLGSSYKELTSGTKITKLVIPEGVTAINAIVFSDSDYIENIVIPESLHSIGDYSFAGCENLKTVYIKSTFTWGNYSSYAFYGMENLTIYVKNNEMASYLSGIYGDQGITVKVMDQ